jgi:hypothetical protein
VRDGGAHRLDRTLLEPERDSFLGPMVARTPPVRGTRSETVSRTDVPCGPLYDRTTHLARRECFDVLTTITVVRTVVRSRTFVSLARR